jgi:tetratricopeptide (TPR) repeat protein
MRIITTVLFTILSTISFVYSQSLPQDTLDPYGFVNKYDAKFDGIGPRVYILPLPRTLKEEMIDTYKEIQNFQDSIYIGFQQQRLISTFKNTSNSLIVQNILPEITSSSDAQKLLQRYIDQKNHSVVYGLYNNIANHYLQQQNENKALEALQLAFTHVQLTNNIQDLAIIQSNLATTYILTDKFDEALRLENLFLDNAIKTKNQADQAVSHAKIAWIHAYKKDYRTAENTIIRKAVPLFNKSKSYLGKIEAWIILADIYRSQNKHTEAQWFLIQARDLAKEHEFLDNLALIEYMLGSSKMIQNNYTVAKSELEIAWDLAQNTPNKYLQIATAEQLGRANVRLGNYETAKDYLTYYWKLRNSLFSENITSPL